MNTRTIVRMVCIWMLPACLVGPMAWAGTNEREVEEDQSLETKLVTPHKPWGRGYVGGPVRVLFVVNAGSYDGSWFSIDTRLREAVELGQRFDLQSDAILVGGGGKPEDFLGKELGVKRAERLLEKPYHVYVFANFPYEKFPTKYQYLVMEQVANGAGLVCCGPAAREFMIPKRRLDPLPAFLADGLPVLDEKAPKDVVSVFRLGKGRGVWLNYSTRSLTPYSEFSWRGLAEYDYRMLWLGRAVLYAACREGEVSVASVHGKTLEQREQMPCRADVTLASRADKPLDVKAAFELRRASDGWKQDLGEASATLAPNQQTALSVQVPRLRADHYFLDAVVKSSRGVEAFGAGAFDVASELGVEEVKVNRTFVERGNRIGGTVFLRGALPADRALQLRFRDSYDRVRDQRNAALASGQTEHAFEYCPDAFATIQMRVEAALLIGGEEIEMKSASFTVPKRRRGQFNFLQWDTPTDVLGYYAWQQLRQAGMEVCLIGSSARSKPSPILQACDVSLVPYSTRIMDEKDDKGVMKPCCWNDEPKAAEHIDKIVGNQAARREHGVFVYSLGDEGVTLGCCVHPACMAAYRRYLADQYGVIDELNASWGTAYKSFDEVDLLSQKDNMENEAAAKGMCARWYDRQAFARHNLMQFSGRFVRGYECLDPEGVTGFEGTGGFGDDYDSIIGINTFYSPYPSIGDDILRSAAPRELIRANWMGYSKTIDPLADAGWRMVIKGMDSVWFWMWTGIGNWRGYLSPTLDFWPATAELADEMKPVRQGLGDLLLQSKMAHSGIAVFYSLPSALSRSLENGREFADPKATHEAWTQLTYELGLDFRYVTSAMIRRGALTTKEFKVLLLPMTQAIAPEEAEAIRAFVQAGGQVIADIRPGIYDGHCKPILPGALDDVFGIKRTGRGKAAHAPVDLKVTLAEQPIGIQLAETRVDTEVQPATAKALAQTGETPILLVNSFGAGRAVLLNFQFLSDQKDDEQAAAARQFLGSLYKAMGVKAVVTVTAPDGGPLPLTETRIWRNGNALVFGMWRRMQCAWFSPTKDTEAGEPVAVKITFPSARHVYDLRTRKHLGHVKKIDASLRWGRANFFLALPYRIHGVRLALSTPAPKPGEILTAAIRLRALAHVRERHAVWVEVIDPKGRSAPWAQQVVVLTDGRGQVQIPAAYNDLPGKWRMRVTELFSNESAEAAWIVK